MWLVIIIQFFIPIIFLFYFRSVATQKSVNLDRWVYFNPFVLIHWLPSSGHMASSLLLQFTPSSQWFQPVLLFSYGLLLSLPTSSSPKLVSMYDSIQSKGEVPAPCSQVWHSAGNQHQPCPKPAKVPSSHTRQLGASAKWALAHKLTPGQNQIHQTSTICLPVTSRSSSKFFKPCFLAGGSLPSLVSAKLPITHSQKTFQCQKTFQRQNCCVANIFHS